MAVRKRILYYSHTRQVSGGERVLLTMLQVLDRARYEPICACPHAGKGKLDEVLRAQGEQVLEAPVLQARFTSNPIKLATYVASFAGAIRTFRKTILASKPDLIHANSIRAGIVATLATAGTKIEVLWHIHDDLPVHPASKVIRQLAFRSARSRFVAVSHATARVFAGGLPFGHRLQVVHNAVDTERFPLKTAPLDAAAQAFRDDVGVSTAQVLVASVGMINARKGQLELIEAWARLAARSRARLVIVGSPIFNDDHLYEARIRSRIAELGLAESVLLLGPRGDVPVILRAADFLVHPAAVEPFGLVLLESIASGTPVLATAVGGIPELLGGFDILLPALTAPSGLDALVVALGEWIEDAGLRQHLASEAYRQVLPQFTIPVFAINLQALYTGLSL